MIRRRDLLFTAVLATGQQAWPAGAAWPIRPVRIVAAGAGGVPDLRARWLADRLSRVLGQPVIVENITGAGGNIGAERVARSAPDGYTLLLLHQGTAAVNPHIYKHTGYDPLTDFAPITRFGQGPLLMAVPASLPYRSVGDVIEQARSRPGELTYGSPGIGTPPHLASELFKHLAAIEATHVPFRGGGQLATALLGGQITWSIEGASVQMGYVNSGHLRALAVTSAKRSAAMPDVPTMAEAGVPGYEFVGWTGVAAPAATPKPIIDRLHADIARIAATEEAKAWFASLGAEPGIQSPEEFTAFIRAEHAKFGTLIREAGIKAE
jgi:tripartite-type tricarboxylate transporter receptor subunit TctC